MVWDSLSRKAQKIKAELDALFDPLSHFSHLNALQAKAVGKHAMIPCIFWFVQKGILSVAGDAALCDQ